MSRILIVGDPHFKNDNVAETQIMAHYCQELIKKFDLKECVVLGDLLHNHSKINLNSYFRCIEWLHGLQATGVNLTILIGNHDRENNQVYCSPVHAFSPLKRWARTRVVDHPVSVTMGGYPVALFPFLPKGRMLEAASEYTINIPKHHVVFAHQEFEGCAISKLGAGADEWPVDYPLCISGHIHDYEKVGHNIIYPGTPFCHNFGERGVKGLHLLTLENLSLETIPLPIPPPQVLSVTPQELENLVILPGKVKVIITGNAEIINSTLKRFDIAQKLKGVKVQCKPVSTLYPTILPEDRPAFSAFLKQRFVTEKLEYVFQLLMQD